MGEPERQEHIQAEKEKVQPDWVAGLPSEVGLNVPEEVEGQLACLLFPGHLLAVLGLPQLVRERHCQVVLADMLLHLQWQAAASNFLTITT